MDYQVCDGGAKEVMWTVVAAVAAAENEHHEANFSRGRSDIWGRGGNFISGTWCDIRAKPPLLRTSVHKVWSTVGYDKCILGQISSQGIENVHWPVRGSPIDGLSADRTMAPVISLLAVPSRFETAAPFIATMGANSMTTLEAEDRCSKSLLMTS